MKKCMYTQAVENVKAPVSLVENTIATLSGAIKESEVVSVKKKKLTMFSRTAAIAAVLALVVTLGAIFIPSSGGGNISHPFVLTVGAAATVDEATADEITRESYVKIGEIKNSGDMLHAGTHGHLDENGNWVITDNDVDVYGVQKEFTLELNCTGKDVESITYTAHNGYLTYNPDYAGLISAVALTEEEVAKYDATAFYDNFIHASSCVFDYNCQPKSSLDFPIEEDTIDGTIPLRMGFNFKFDEGEYTIAEGYNNIYLDSDADEIFMNEFNAHADEFALDVTANFSDGSSTTKTLKFRCEKEGINLYMYAIEV